MAKPTRKHPSFNSIVDSPQGVEFVHMIQQYVGHFDYEPLATFDAGRRHLFTITGPGGTGILSEAWEEPDGADAIGRWNFYTTLPSGLEVCGTLDVRRWSAGSELHVTGVEPFPDVSAAERKELEQERRTERASESDRLRLSIAADGAAWTDLSGIDRDTVMGELVRRDIRVESLGQAAPAIAGGRHSDTVEGTRARVQELLTAGLPGVQQQPNGTLTFPVGSARVFVEVREWVDPAGIVTVFAITNKAVPRSEELFEYLASHSDQFVFGRLAAWLPEEDPNRCWLVFRHTILGGTLDPDELRASVVAVASSADELDDKIKECFGGYLFHEEIPEQGDRAPDDELPAGFYL